MNWYTVQETADIFKVGPETIRLWLKEGRFAHRKKNGHWRIPQCCIDDPDGSHHIEVAGEPETKAPESPEAIELTGLDAELTKLEKANLIEDRKIDIAAKKLRFKTPEDYTQALQKLADDEGELQRDWLSLENKKSALAIREDELTNLASNLEGRKAKVAELAELLDQINAAEDQPKWDAYKVEHGSQARHIYPAQVEKYWDAISKILYEIADINDGEVSEFDEDEEGEE